jgi:hypothetical protein
VVSALVAVQACSNPAPLVGSGGTCAVTTDCQSGLACVPQPNGTRQCTSDFSGIQTTEDAGADGGGTTEDATTPPADGTTPEESSTPPPDSGSTQQDTGSPPPDTGSPPQEAGE